MAATDVVLGSSVRSVPAEVTLARARRKARELGITRVTDITRLDRVGLPVYASIRPGATVGSLCVNAGKGLRPVEAEVGATMEAIEFALAEQGASPVKTVWATSRDILDGRRRPDAILDLCPKLGTTIALDAPIEAVVAEETATGERALVPAELVFLPFRPGGRRRKLHFGSSSNGLASGNTLQEATVHALCEIIERDVRSFQALRDTGVPVALDTVDGPAGDLVDGIRTAGLELHVRAADNGLGVPYFMALIHDPESPSPQLLNAGHGCHPIRSVAFVRAVTEAAQSRLTIIHGGRDDLTDREALFKGWSSARKRAWVARAVGRVSAGKRVPFSRLPDLAAEAATIEASERVLSRQLRSSGFDRVYRVAFCAPDDELQVVRVLVPRMEFFTAVLARVGPRLRDHARAS